MAAIPTDTWCCKLRPTGRSWNKVTPARSSSSAGPIPDTMSRCAEPTTPADRITSFRARTMCSPYWSMYLTPCTRLFSLFNTNPVTRLLIFTNRLGLPLAGLKYARDVLILRPFSTITWAMENPEIPKFHCYTYVLIFSKYNMYLLH